MNAEMSKKMAELRKFIAPEFVFGAGALELVGQYALNFGAKKAFVVTDPGLEEHGWLKRVERCLREKGVSYSVFRDVTPNPEDYEVMAGAERYAHEGCDVIVALGGGSPMDCAKGIGIVSSNNRHVLEFEGIDEVPLPGPPLICIPTTAGTSADVSQFAIISDTDRHVKIAIISNTVIPDVALIDPETTQTMSPELTAATGLDALTHAFEAYVSNASAPLTDLHALQAIRLISQNLVDAVRNPASIEFRTNMMQASLLAGLAFSNASLGLVHAMAHSLGGLLDLAHGECNAILLEHVVDFNFDAAVDKYCDIGRAFGCDFAKNTEEDVKMELLHAVATFRKSVGIHASLGDLGVFASDLAALATHASHDPCVITNPKIPSVQEIEECYGKAL